MRIQTLLLLSLALSACGGVAGRDEATLASNTTDSTGGGSTPPEVLLTVGKLGEGTLTSTPAGIDCGTACFARFGKGTLVSLTAVPASGWRLAAYSGACNGAECSITLDQAANVTAQFVLDTGSGDGGVPTAKSCAAYSGPALDTLKAYEGLMHEHSSYSDGDPASIPADYFRIAEEKGYSFVGSSEHSDTYDSGVYFTAAEPCVMSPDGFRSCFLNPSADKLQKWNSTAAQIAAANDPNSFLGIRGFEWTSDVFGHINVYFSRNFSNAKTDGGFANTMETFWGWFTRAADTPGEGGSPTSPVPNGGGADALAHFNHPHDKCLTEDDPSGATVGFCDWNDYTLVPDAVERMFGLEVYSEGTTDRYHPFFMRALDKGWRVAPIGSEDEHFGEYAVEHRPKTVTLATELTETGFRNAWLARRTYALSPGQHLRIVLEVEGHPMGAQLSCDTGKALRIQVRVAQVDGTPYTGSLELFRSGSTKLGEVALDQGQGFFDVDVAAGTTWYYVRVLRPGGVSSAAYLAPVWISSR